MFTSRALSAISALLVLVGLFCLMQRPRAQMVSSVQQSPGIAIPSPASGAGYNTTLIFDGFDHNTVDIQQTNAPGFNWYTKNPSQLPSSFCVGVGGTCPNPTPSWYSIRNSNFIATSGTTGGMDVMSFAYINSSTQLRTLPLIPGASGFYFEGRVKFQLPVTTGAFQPDLWLQDYNGTLSQYAGAGTTRFGEIDVIEGLTIGEGGPPQTVHNWTAWNTSTISQSGANLTALDYTQYHTWGALLVPMSQGGGTGSLKWFVDRVQTGSTVTWTSTATFGIAEVSNYQINFAANKNMLYQIDYIGVWVP